MNQQPVTTIDRRAFAAARAELGGAFLRILSYYREDALKSLVAIEQAMRGRDAAALVSPAHKLKGESLQLGAEPLGALAEHIEQVARRCVERRESPHELVEHVTRLRPMLEETLAMFDRETNPVVERRAGFGRKVVQPPPARA